MKRERVLFSTIRSKDNSIILQELLPDHALYPAYIAAVVASDDDGVARSYLSRAEAEDLYRELGLLLWASDPSYIRG